MTSAGAKPTLDGACQRGSGALGPPNIDLVQALTADEMLSNNIAHIEQMIPGEDVALSKRRLDLRRHLPIRKGGQESFARL